MSVVIKQCILIMKTTFWQQSGSPNLYNNLSISRLTTVLLETHFFFWGGGPGGQMPKCNKSCFELFQQYKGKPRS
jgi:hypothetical protein